MIPKPNRTIFVLLVVASNLFPLYLYAQGSWSVFMFFYLYWLETVIISVFTSLKIISALGHAENEAVPSLGKRLGRGIKFFITMFFLLCFYLLFLVVFIGVMGTDKNEMVQTVSAVVFRDTNFNLALVGFILSHGFDFLFNYLLTNENEKKSGSDFSLLFDPRIIVIHVSIVLSAFALTSFDFGFHIIGHTAGSYIALSIFIALKTAVDLGSSIIKVDYLKMKNRE